MYGTDGGSYELLTFSSMDGGASGVGADPSEHRRGPCLAAVFLARNRFAVLDKNRQVSRDKRLVMLGITLCVTGVSFVSAFGVLGDV